jgi:imidazolonepropionase-like amidohydrolase
MPRFLAPLLALLLVLSGCAAATPPVANIPTIQPSVTPRPPTSTVLPASPTPVPSPLEPLPPTPEPLPAYDLVLLNATLIDATGAPALPQSAIGIRGGRIAAIGAAATFVYAPTTRVRDLSGATIMPAFVNAHAHVSGLSDDQLRQWTSAGVTTLRDLASPSELIARRNELAAGGDPTLPRLLVSGPTLSVPGGHPFPVSSPVLRVHAIAVRGPADAHAVTARMIADGIDQIKIAVSGRTDVSWPELSDAEIQSITETARAYGVRVSAHVDRASGLRRAVRNGVHDAAHAPRDRIPDDLIAEMVEREVAMVPTIAVYEALADSRSRVVEWRRITQPIMYDNLRRFAAAGGLLALGDDYGGVPGMSLGMPMAEMKHWLKAGLSPLEIITAATRNSAIVVGLGTELGTIEVGKRADLLVVAGDPLNDIYALKNPLLVLRDGVEIIPAP